MQKLIGYSVEWPRSSTMTSMEKFAPVMYGVQGRIATALQGALITDLEGVGRELDLATLSQGYHLVQIWLIRFWWVLNTDINNRELTNADLIPPLWNVSITVDRDLEFSCEFLTDGERKSDSIALGKWENEEKLRLTLEVLDWKFIGSKSQAAWSWDFWSHK